MENKKRKIKNCLDYPKNEAPNFIHPYKDLLLIAELEELGAVQILCHKCENSFITSYYPFPL